MIRYGTVDNIIHAGELLGVQYTNQGDYYGKYSIHIK